MGASYTWRCWKLVLSKPVTPSYATAQINLTSEKIDSMQTILMMVYPYSITTVITDSFLNITEASITSHEGWSGLEEANKKSKKWFWT